MRLLPVSATQTLPAPSASMPVGLFSWSLVPSAL
jgi:hypothetical protein